MTRIHITIQTCDEADSFIRPHNFGITCLECQRDEHELDHRKHPDQDELKKIMKTLIKDSDTKEIFKDKYSQAVNDLKALENWYKVAREEYTEDEFSSVLLEGEYVSRKEELTKRKAKFHRLLMINTGSYKEPTGHLSDAELDALKQIPMLDLVDLSVSRSTNDRSTAICPFHKEASASFTIYHDSNTAHCFGCNWNGDNIAAVMEYNSVGFMEAIKIIQGL